MLSRRLSVGIVALLVLFAAFSARAIARHGVGGSQKRVIMTAAGVSPQAPLHCFGVYVSTASSTWAATSYGGASTKPCLTDAADGISVTRYIRGRWRFVTAGSAFNCPIPGHIPGAVQRDLRLFCH